jgi:hypothetical protein
LASVLKGEPMKPTAFDIIHAIETVHRRDWIDPVDYPDDCWACNVYDANGVRIGDGHGFSAGEAMGLAWICVWYPDALIHGCIPHNDVVPYDVPDSWRFELVPPAVAPEARRT